MESSEFTDTEFSDTDYSDISAYLEKVTPGLMAKAAKAEAAKAKAPQAEAGQSPADEAGASLQRAVRALAAQGNERTDSWGKSSEMSREEERPCLGPVIPSSAPSSPRVRMVEEFMKHVDESDDWLQKWYAENYEKANNYEFLRYELLSLLKENMEGIDVDENIDTRNLVDLLQEMVQRFYFKLNKFNLQMRDIPGMGVAGQIKDHHRRVLEVVEDYEKKLTAANDELAQYKEQVIHLDAELSAAFQRMMHLERGTIYFGGFEDSVSEDQFMADLKSRVAHSEMLNSSMKVELQKERQQNEGLQRQLAHVAREKVAMEEKCMQDIVEFSRRAEINSMLEKDIMDLLAKNPTKEPDSQECQKIIDAWMVLINETINKNAQQIDELIKKCEGQSKEIETLEAQAIQQNEKLEKMREQVQNQKSLFDKYKADAASFRAHIDEVRKEISELHHESYGLTSFWARVGAQDTTADLEKYDLQDKLIGPIDGEVAEFDLLQDTLPIRYGQRQRKRRERPLLYVSSYYDEESSGEAQQLPMEGLGAIRIEDDDEFAAVGARSPTLEISGRRGQLIFQDGQWIEVDGGAPQVAPQRELPSGAGLMGPVRLDQAGWAPVGGRLSPIEGREQAGGGMRFSGGQWVSESPRTPQRPSPPRLHSTLRDISPRQSRIPTRPGATSPGPDISRIPHASPRPRTPTRLEVPGMQPTTTRAATGRRLEVPGMQLTTPRAGTARRLGASGMGPATARTGAAPRAGVSVMGPATARTGAAPRAGVSDLGPARRVAGTGMRPTATRPGTPPRPCIYRQAPSATGARVPQAPVIPRMQPTTPRGARQRQGAPGVQPTIPRGAGTRQRQGASGVQPQAAIPQADSLMSRVMLLSPQRQEPLALDVDVAPQNIMPSGEEFVCQVAVGVHPAAPEAGGQNVRRDQRARRPRPHFTPRTGFQR